LIAVEKCDVNRPLSEKEDERIRNNFDQLAEIIDLKSGLMNYLIACNCISKRHKAAITLEKLDDFQRNEELLTILQHRSYADYLLFLDCLRHPDVNQEYVATVLTEDGGIIIII